MKRVFAVVILAVAITGCTPSQIAKWLEWYAADPQAALEFANRPEIQEQLHVDPEAGQISLNENPNISNDSVWDDLAQCESGQRWDYNGGSGYDGGLQFLPSTWRAYGGRDYSEYAYQASREQQIDVAERVLDDVGWQAWPACSRKLGLR